MATVTLKGNPVHTIGNLPKIGSKTPDFKLTKQNMTDVGLSEYLGKKLVLNIFQSIDTRTCAKSVRKFNETVANFDNTVVLCISKDLPFAQTRFCGAEGITNVETLSDFRDGNFGKAYGVEYIDGPIKGLHARAVVVVDEAGKVLYTEQVAEASDEPNYTAALEALTNA